MKIPSPFSGSLCHWKCLLALCLLGVLGTAQAQTARKPSYYENQKQQAARIAAPDSPVAQRSHKGSVPFLPQLKNRADFDLLARVYNRGTPSEIPHILVVIDLQNENRTYFVNTPRFELHERFVKERKLLINPSREQINESYERADRRFLFVTLSWQAQLKGYSYEFWEGDVLTDSLLKTTDKVIHEHFFAPIVFKTNSTLHETIAERTHTAFVTQAALIKEAPYAALNTGRAKGRLRIVSSLEKAPDIAPSDIVVLREVPISLSPVAGVITEQPSTVLSHVNLLAKGWRIPNAYIRNAAQALKEYDGQWVDLLVQNNQYRIQAIAPQAPKQHAVQKIILKSDLETDVLVPLFALREADGKRCGTKGGNLGELKAARIPDTDVPDGFCIPFAQYAQFMRAHHLEARVQQMQAVQGFANDARVRQSELERLREEITHWPVEPKMAQQWLAQWKTQLHEQGVFVRSSSNSEDLPNFSGAGLYTTVPNVRSAQALEMAVKRVWASVFNFEAYEARSALGFPHNAVVMGVFVQTAVDSESSGVMITRDPFDDTHPYITYISAKRGIGIKVVEGTRIAEQVMYSSWSKAIQVLSQSAETSALQLDKNGGVQEVPIAQNRAVLNDELVKRLAKTADAIKQTFGNKDQDIEWAVREGKILLLQARPYVAGK